MLTALVWPRSLTMNKCGDKCCDRSQNEVRAPQGSLYLVSMFAEQHASTREACQAAIGLTGSSQQKNDAVRVHLKQVWPS